MEKILGNCLNEVSSVNGVRSAYLINNRGEILMPQTERLGRANLTPTSALELIQAMGVFEMAGEDITEMEISFLDGKLIVYNNIKLNVPTKYGVQETLLVVLGEKNLNKSHLRLSLNVNLVNVYSDKKYKKLDQPVRIRKTSVLTREKLGEKEVSQAEKIRSLTS